MADIADVRDRAGNGVAALDDEMSGYFKSDVDERAKLIRFHCPRLQIEQWMDYGFRLDVVRPDGERMTVMQPYRPENGQPLINLPVSKVIEFSEGGA